MTDVRVHLDAGGGLVVAGTARVTRLRGTDTTEFTYDDRFLAGQSWELSPDLPLARGRTVVRGLPGALLDSAPDTWGRNLITRREAARARDAGHPAPTLTEADFLLGVADTTRQGALRLCLDDAGPYLAERTEVPRLLELGKLLDAARRIAEDRDAPDAVAVLLDAGSGSLGGARPKASVLDGDVLHIAKFPHHQDRWDVMRWEAVALDLAAACGLRTPAHQLLEVAGEPVLLVERFDRAEGARRIGYLSGQSLIGANEATAADYLELVDALTAHGSDVAADLVELWRRIAFSIAINNTDDHMRNHGFLRGKGGWTLAPIFDVNPNPAPAASRATSIGGATTPDDCLEALFQLSSPFGLSESAARSQWRDLVATIARWREDATARGVPAAEQEQFSEVLDRWSGPI